MRRARIFQYGTRSWQEGQARADSWVLEAEPVEGQLPDPLMGWAGSGDTEQQLRLYFPTVAEAEAYAARNGIKVEIGLPENKPRILQSYADNFH